jgi:hypothetical protein
VRIFAKTESAGSDLGKRAVLGRSETVRRAVAGKVLAVMLGQEWNGLNGVEVQGSDGFGGQAGRAKGGAIVGEADEAGVEGGVP